MELVEVTARTVEEAREKALDLLGVTEDDTELEVLAEPKMGLFGRVREEARVRARLLPSVPRSRDESRRRRGGRGPAEAAVAPAEPVAVVAAETAAVDEPKPRQRSERVFDDDRVEVPLADQAEVARGFVEGLLTTMGFEGTSAAVALIDEGTAEVQVSLAEGSPDAAGGGDLGLLIGPKGATLLALQDVTRTVVQRRTGARTGRLLLDVGGYRQRRKAALERFTQKVAQDVLAGGEPIPLEPMNAADRKVVHDSANAIEGVTTSSEGEDPRRHVVIHPA